MVRSRPLPAVHSRLVFSLLPVAAVAAGSLAAQQPHDHGAGPVDWVPESVDMAASASEPARLFLNRGIEALHNFWYEAARDAYRQLLAQWADADADRPELAEARAFLAR